MTFIEEYEGDFFWDELLECPAERDLVRELGEKGIESLGLEGRSKKQGHDRKKCDEGFRKHVDVRKAEIAGKNNAQGGTLSVFGRKSAVSQ